MSATETEVSREIGNPYKLVDYNREKRKGVTATSLKELINNARTRFNIPTEANIMIVLEQDGEKNLFCYTYCL